jgi:hypothetical protein
MPGIQWHDHDDVMAMSAVKATTVEQHRSNIRESLEGKGTFTIRFPWEQREVLRSTATQPPGVPSCSTQVDRKLVAIRHMAQLNLTAP